MIARILAALLFALILATAGTAFGATLPWTKFSEQAKDVVHAALGTCGDAGEMFVGFFMVDGVLYQSFYGAESGVYVLAVYAKDAPAGAVPLELGVGKVDPAKHDEIPSLRWQKYDPNAGLTPCGMVYPAKA